MNEGTYNDKKKNALNVKYDYELCIYFGVYSFERLDGTREGICCTTFDYGGKTIVSIDDFEKLIKDEIERVKKLKGSCLP